MTRNILGILLLCEVCLIGGKGLAQSAQNAKSPVQAAVQRGKQALQKGDVVTARKEFERAVQLSPSDASAQSALGWVLAQQGEPAAAEEHLRAALKAKPSFIDARLTLAGVLAQLKASTKPERRSPWRRRMRRHIAPWREF